MAISVTPYRNVYPLLLSAGLDFTADTIKVALITSGYSPDADNDTDFSFAAAAETTGTGYTSGGLALSGLTYDYNATDRIFTVEADTAIWATATLTCRYAVFYKAPSPLLFYMDFGADRSVTAEDFQIAFPNGLVRLRQP